MPSEVDYSIPGDGYMIIGHEREYRGTAWARTVTYQCHAHLDPDIKRWWVHTDMSTIEIELI